jgi:hypothetical protein
MQNDTHLICKAQCNCRFDRPQGEIARVPTLPSSTHWNRPRHFRRIGLERVGCNPTLRPRSSRKWLACSPEQ